MRAFFFLMLTLALQGCAQKSLQSDLLLEQSHDWPQDLVLQDVPFISQPSYQCGPTVLAMAMNWGGRQTSLQKLIQQTYSPKSKGSWQMNMISTSRRHGFLAIPIKGFHQLIQELAAGHPVIVFENLGLSWWPQWHYALAVGYDLQNREIILHSGPEAYKREDMKSFESSWKLAQYWGLVVLPASKLVATGSQGQHIEAAVALEKLDLIDEAQNAYLSILQRWPDSYLARMGLSNTYYRQKKYQDAISTLEVATSLRPNSFEAWYNLTMAYGAVSQNKKAKASALRAFLLASLDEKNQYQKNLKRYMKPTSHKGRD